MYGCMGGTHGPEQVAQVGFRRIERQIAHKQTHTGWTAGIQ
jgi:hypothetical protein